MNPVKPVDQKQVAATRLLNDAATTHYHQHGPGEFGDCTRTQCAVARSRVEALESGSAESGTEGGNAGTETPAPLPHTQNDPDMGKENELDKSRLTVNLGVGATAAMDRCVERRGGGSVMTEVINKAIQVLDRIEDLPEGATPGIIYEDGEIERIWLV